jgi:hypothetical protein
VNRKAEDEEIARYVGGRLMSESPFEVGDATLPDDLVSIERLWLEY